MKPSVTADVTFLVIIYCAITGGRNRWVSGFMHTDQKHKFIIIERCINSGILHIFAVPEERNSKVFRSCRFEYKHKCSINSIIITNEEVFQRAKEERLLLNILNNRRHSWIGHIIRHSEFVVNNLEGAISGEKAMGRPRLQYLKQVARNIGADSYTTIK
jgi:hypothetical protein